MSLSAPLQTTDNLAESAARVAELLTQLPSGDAYPVHNTPLHKLPGARADPTKKSLSIYEKRDFTHALGTEFPASSGIQLSKLSPQQVEDLALLVAERGVVVFRNQELSVDEQVALGKKLGPLHVHPMGWANPGKEEVQEINAGRESKSVPGELWHSDVSFEVEGNAYAILKIDEPPLVGGDTVFLSAYAAYDKLSEPMKKFVEGLEAWHSNAHWEPYTLRNKTNGFMGGVRRGPLTTLHPVVRTHPLTKYKTLFVNEMFTTHIKNLTRGESDAILGYLLNHIAKGEDFKIRIKLEKNDVAIWDNRATQHLAIFDYWPQTRKGFRVCTSGERPFFDPVNSKSQAQEIEEQLGGVNPVRVRSVL